MSPYLPQISVIVCTHNRSASLRRLLESCRQLVIPPEVTWELLVVANACTDDTHTMASSFQKTLPLRLLEMPEPGKSAALNQAVQAAQGSVLLFTDDDVTVDPHWVAAYWNAACSHPSDAFFGGPVIPEWEDGEPPRWVSDNLNLDLLIVLRVDHGTQPFLISRPCFVGANMAARKQLFTSGSVYDERIGPKGTTKTADNKVDGEEIVLQRQWINHGLAGRYVPAAVIHHYHPVNRLTEGRLRLSHTGKGIREVRLGLVKYRRMLLGAPFYFWRLWFTGLLQYAVARCCGPSRAWVTAEMKFSYAWGVISESRKTRPL